MEDRLDLVLNDIECQYDGKIGKGSRHYVEVSLADRAMKLGYVDLAEKYGRTQAIIPLRHPEKGMKVRIDGRTFVNYAEYDSGVALPGYLAKESKRGYKTFIPNDSMICNFG